MAAIVEQRSVIGSPVVLNEGQARAATFGRMLDERFVSDPLLIIAGAGTGKTNTLAHRVAHLLLKGVAPEEILLLTFSRRASQEMIRRAQRIVEQALMERSGSAAPSSAGRLTWAGTFHSIAVRLLRQYAPQLSLDPQFSVMDRGDSADLMDIARQALDLSRTEKRFPRKDTCLAIYSHCINTQGSLDDTLNDIFPWCSEWRAELTNLFRKYVEIKQSQQVLDYDDLLLYCHILMQQPLLARDIGAQFAHVLVDEYQDTNVLQAQILRALKPDGQGLCVVGDDAQAIYSFRAATVENILEFPRQFNPPATMITLEHNYRSVQPVLDTANALMADSARQYQKRLVSNRTSQQKPHYVTVEDDRGQAEYVVAQILSARERGTLLKEQAILMRSSHHSDFLELELTRRNIPYVKYGGLKFLESSHVKDVLAVLRWADNPRHQMAAYRTLQLLPGIGSANAERCFKVFEASNWSWETLSRYQMPSMAAADWPTTATLLKNLAQSVTWDGQLTQVREWYVPHLQRIHESAAVRLADLEQLERLALQFGTREKFLTELTLDPPQASGDLSGPPLRDEDYLVLSTIHSAKGQEWKSVYILNVADGNFPNEFSTGKPQLIEEERRLLYVAMTRAKEALHLIAPMKYYVSQQPRRGDAHVTGAKSRFMTSQVMNSLSFVGWSSDCEVVQRGMAKGSALSTRVDAAALAREIWRS
jgi:DNA helicase II / ATP-dependent DNA helicase PcrA